ARGNRRGRGARPGRCPARPAHPAPRRARPGGEDDEMTQPVIAGVDGSDRGLEAARFAADEASRRGAPLRLVTVVSWPYDGLSAPPPDLDLPALLHRSGESVVGAAADTV